MIRVVHVSPTDLQGGACLGAYNLHKAIQARGVDSRMLVLRKFSDDPSVVPRNEGMLAKFDALRDPMDRLPLRSYRWDSSNWWSAVPAFALSADLEPARHVAADRRLPLCRGLQQVYVRLRQLSAAWIEQRPRSEPLAVAQEAAVLERRSHHLRRAQQLDGFLRTAESARPRERYRNDPQWRRCRAFPAV